MKMNESDFIEKHCLWCGTQRCEGIATVWFDGCPHRFELKGYEDENS